eukprot:m51a1_g3470 hypothetical protein (477) ;mRNA; f:743993-745752
MKRAHDVEGTPDDTDTANKKPRLDSDSTPPSPPPYPPAAAAHPKTDDQPAPPDSESKKAAAQQQEQQEQAAPEVPPPSRAPAEQPPRAASPAQKKKGAGRVVDAQQWFEHIAGIGEKEFRESKPPPIEVLDAPDVAPLLPGHCLAVVNTKTGRKYGAGKFSLVSLEFLQKLLPRTGDDQKPCTLELVYGSVRGSMAKLDVGAMQSDPANAGAVFQAASNFNAVEAPAPSRSPDHPTFTEQYIYDHTQGPLASISAGAAAITRVHAPFFDQEDCSFSWAQTRERQVEMLSNLKEYFTVRNGYVEQTGKEKPLPDSESELSKLRSKVCVGVHSSVEVIFGPMGYGSMPAIDSTRKIDQVFCAAMNVGQGMSGMRNCELPDCIERIRLLLEAAYEATYLAAIANGRERLFLTLVGGGVFDNPIDEICGAVARAHSLCTTHPASTLKHVTLVMWDRKPRASFLKELLARGIPYDVTELSQ